MLSLQNEVVWLEILALNKYSCSNLTMKREQYTKIVSLVSWRLLPLGLARCRSCVFSYYSCQSALKAFNFSTKRVYFASFMTKTLQLILILPRTYNCIWQRVPFWLGSRLIRQGDDVRHKMGVIMCQQCLAGQPQWYAMESKVHWLVHLGDHKMKAHSPIFNVPIS